MEGRPWSIWGYVRNATNTSGLVEFTSNLTGGNMIERLVLGLSGIIVGLSVIITTTPRGHITHWGAFIASIFDILLGLVVVIPVSKQ